MTNASYHGLHRLKFELLLEIVMEHCRCTGISLATSDPTEIPVSVTLDTMSTISEASIVFDGSTEKEKSQQSSPVPKHNLKQHLIDYFGWNYTKNIFLNYE